MVTMVMEVITMERIMDIMLIHNTLLYKDLTLFFIHVLNYTIDLILLFTDLTLSSTDHQ